MTGASGILQVTAHNIKKILGKFGHVTPAAKGLLHQGRCVRYG